MQPTFRIGGYGFLVIVGLCGALVSGRPEPALLAAPFVLVLAVGLVLGPPPGLWARHALSVDRAIEGDEMPLTINVAPEVEVEPMLPPGIEIVDRDSDRGALRLLLRPERWGAFDVGTAALRSHDALRLWRREATVASRVVLRVHPSADRLRRTVTALELQPFVGQHTSRRHGDGFEFAELRPYVPGDRASRISWRASARRGGLWVSDRHPEQTTDVVLLLDTFGEDRPDRVDILDGSIRVLASVAAALERSHDRVGLLSIGGHLRWLRPRAGRTNLVRIVDGLLDAERLLSETGSDVVRVPVGALPRRALLLAVTALESDTVADTLVDLRGRGFDVAVLTVPPPDSDDARADRLDALRRSARRMRLERLGVAVGDTADGLDTAIEEVNGWRRRVLRVRG